MHTASSLTICLAAPPPPPPCHACSLPCTPTAMQAPIMHAPLPHMPPATHIPCHACPPAMHAPLPHMPPNHTHTPPPPASHTPCHAHPCVDRILDIRFWKYYLAPTSLRALKRRQLKERNYADIRYDQPFDKLKNVTKNSCPVSLRRRDASVSSRHVVSAGPLGCGHLIWPQVHLVSHSTDLDLPPRFKNQF